MSASLSPQTIAIVKATVPALADHGAAITGAMYRRLFEAPEITALFNTANQENGAQVHALATAVLAYARNIENLGVLGPAVERISQKHIGYAIKAEHYPYDEGFTLAEYAATLTEVGGRPVAYRDLPENEYREALQGMGLPAPVARMVAQSSASAADGALFDDGRALSRLIGRPTTSLTSAIAGATRR